MRSPEPAEVAKPDHANNFTLMRLVFAVLVLVSHSFELVDNDRHREPLSWLFHNISFGELAVDGFFVLSGYLVAQSYLRSKNAWQYLEKRALRIYPGFIVSGLVGTFVIGYLFATNRATYFQELRYFDVAKYLVKLVSPVVPPTLEMCPRPIVNGALWTIRYEALCYGLVLILGLIKVLNRRMVVGTLFAVSLGIYLWHCRTDILAAQGHLSRFVTFFLAGTVMLLFREHLRIQKPMAVVGCCLLLVISQFQPVISQLALVTVGSVLLFAFAEAKSSILIRIRPKTDISYGTYLYGWPIQQMLIASGLKSPGLLLLVTVPLALLCGVASWFLVESPALKVKARL